MTRHHRIPEPIRYTWFMGAWGRWVRHSARFSSLWWSVTWAFHTERQYHSGWYFTLGRSHMKLWTIKGFWLGLREWDFSLWLGIWHVAAGHTKNL